LPAAFDGVVLLLYAHQLLFFGLVVTDCTCMLPPAAFGLDVTLCSGLGVDSPPDRYSHDDETFQDSPAAQSSMQWDNANWTLLQVRRLQ